MERLGRTARDCSWERPASCSLLIRRPSVRAGRATERVALKLRPAGAADGKDGLHWAFQQRRRPRADSFKRLLGSTVLNRWTTEAAWNRLDADARAFRGTELPDRYPCIGP